MWIVQLALRRPYTFIVVALLIMITGPLMILSYADRYLPEHRYSDPEHRLVVQRVLRR